MSEQQLIERTVWIITSVIGLTVAAIYMSLVWAQIQTAQKSRFALQLPQLWGQFTSGGFQGLRFVFMLALGILAITESPIAQTWGVRILVFGNTLAVLSIMVMVVSLNWTVHQDDEENATVAEEIATGEIRPQTMANMAISKENPLPVEVVEVVPPVIVVVKDPNEKEEDK